MMADITQRSLTEQPPNARSTSSIICRVDDLAGLQLRGWALDQASPRTSPVLHVIVDGQEISQIVCDDGRPDLQTVSPGYQRLGFQLALSKDLADNESHKLEVRDRRRREVPIILNGQEYPHIDFRIEWKPNIRSHVDGVRHGAFEGWVVRTQRDSFTLVGDCMVRVTCDGMTIGHVRAGGFRGDVARITGGPTNCGFRFEPPTAVRSGHVREFRFFLMPENIELDNSPCNASLVEDETHARLLVLTGAVDALHRELTRIRRQLHELAPQPRYTVGNYDRWFRAYEPALRKRVAGERPVDNWSNGPLVSILCPVYRPSMGDFEAAIASIQAQTYSNFELILVDDNSKDLSLTEFMTDVAAKDKRIKLFCNRKNLRISGATNVALKAATGEWIAFFDHDDVLVDVAIECMVAAALSNGADMLYSDEDKLDQDGHYVAPALKPDWNHRLLMGVNYVCHLLFIRRSLTELIGPFDSKYDGAQDHDYILRLSEKIPSTAIHHVPEVLYHWRITPGSTAETVDNKHYAIDAGLKAVRDHLIRIGRTATVEAINGQTLYRQTWTIEQEPRVAIIIPYKDQIEITERCLDTVLGTTHYKNFEIVMVDNWSTSQRSIGFAKRVKKLRNVRIMRIEEQFNYSRLNNLASADSDADFFMFMNNDVFVSTPSWLQAVVGEAVVDPKVGAVGGKFSYPDGTVQHGGVVTGIGGVAGHVHTGLPDGDYGYAGRLLFAQEMTAVTAAGVLVRATAFRAVGGFDEKMLQVAFNDIDLCLKLRKAGYKIIWTPAFAAEHHESFSRGDDERPMQETRFFNEIEVMKDRWGDTLTKDPFYNPNFLLDQRPFFDLINPTCTLTP